MMTRDSALCRCACAWTLVLLLCGLTSAAAPTTAPTTAPVEENKQFTFKSKHYVITTDVDKDLAKDIAKHMDAVFEEYSNRMSGFKAKDNNPMPLYVWSTYDQYLKFTASMGFNAANSGGVFFVSQKGSGLSTWVEGQGRLKMYYVLQHEGFHQFAHARIAPNLPPWVNEGLAEYFGDALLVNGDLVPGKLDMERLHRIARAIEEHTYLDFKTLMTMDNNEWVRRVTSGAKESSLMYDMSWSVCYFLIHSDKAKYRPALEKYLDILSKGTENQEAFDTIFGTDLKSFEDAWTGSMPKLEPDPWFTSVRRMQFYAEILKQMHAAKFDVQTFPKLREAVIMNGLGATIEERDIVKRGKKDVKLGNESEELNFPKPAEVELVRSDDPALPHGLVVRGLKPTTIRLSWSINKQGNLVEEISYDKTDRQDKADQEKKEKAAKAQILNRPTTQATTQPTTVPTRTGGKGE